MSAEGLFKGTPGCRAADARNKAMKGLDLAQELSSIDGQADDAAKLSTQSQVLTDLIDMIDTIRTPFSFGFQFSSESNASQKLHESLELCSNTVQGGNGHLERATRSGYTSRSFLSNYIGKGGDPVSQDWGVVVEATKPVSQPNMSARIGVFSYLL